METSRVKKIDIDYLYNDFIEKFVRNSVNCNENNLKLFEWLYTATFSVQI